MSDHNSPQSSGKLKLIVIPSLIAVGVLFNVLSSQSSPQQLDSSPSNNQQSIDLEDRGEVSAEKFNVEATVKPTPIITTKIIEEVASIPYSEQTVNDPTLSKGVSQVTQRGSVGEQVVLYEITLQDGQETGKEEISNRVSRQPVSQITSVGTKEYVAPTYNSSCSGGYINVHGNCVQSPGSNPSGASAKCRDGTYSYSQSRRGTCSGHGGVATWL